MTMPVGPLDHFTIRVEPAALAAVRTFYVKALGLVEGARPNFAFHGHWLYTGEQAVVHLAGVVQADETTVPNATGSLDHIAFKAAGLAEARSRLRAAGISWREAPVPGMALHQIFITDPCGVMLELTFDAAELQALP
ncbi:MAG: glyoxalase [Hyphomicrobium sp.]|nr:glyoxalase [Hyphomicrobium sp.]